MNKALIASAALALTAVFSAAAVHADPAVAPTAAAAPGWHHGHHSPLLGALRQLDLSDAQKASIRQIFESHRASAKAEYAGYRAQHRAFAALDPAAPDYQQQVNGYSDQAAAAARQRTQEQAQLKSAVIAVLTPEQKAQLLAALANPPARRSLASPAG